MKKSTRIEILWLTAPVLAATALSALLTGFNRPLFLPFLGMEFAMSPAVFVVGLFLCLGFLVFGARAVIASFQNRPVNFIFIGFTGIAILGAALMLVEVSKWSAANGNWTLYPPYSKHPSPESVEEYDRVKTGLIVILTALILTVTTTVVRMIRRKN